MKKNYSNKSNLLGNMTCPPFQRNMHLIVKEIEQIMNFWGLKVGSKYFDVK
jgi:hypothetical protein